MTSINTISTLQQSMSLRARVAEQKAGVDKAGAELSTGLRQDVFEARGAAPAQSLELRAALSSNDSFRVANELLSREMDVTATVLSDVRGTTAAFSELLISGDIAATNRQIVKDNAKQALAAIVDKLNTTYNGNHIFSGLSGDQRPLTINPDNSVTYNGDTTGNLSRRIDTDTMIEYGIRADNPAFMDALNTLTSIINTDLDAMSNAAFSTFREAAVQTMAQAGENMTGLQSRLGDFQGRLERTIDGQYGLSNILNQGILDIEGVDPEDAAVRLESLSIQLQSTFEVTARLSKLSFLNHI